MVDYARFCRSQFFFFFFFFFWLRNFESGNLGGDMYIEIYFRQSMEILKFRGRDINIIYSFASELLLPNVSYIFIQA